MKIGLCLPYMKAGLTREDYHAWFRHIDQGPFHSLSCGERILGPTYDMRVLLASAAARKSPFLMALGPIVALVVLERMLFGTRHVADTVWRHIPHADDGSSMGFYPYGLDWATQDLPGLFVGLTFAGLTLAATIYLRHSRFDV